MDTVVNVALTANDIEVMSSVMAKIANAKPTLAVTYNWYNGVIPNNVKRCSTCQIYKDKKAFGRKAQNPDGLNYDCRPCHAAYQRERYWVKRMALLESYSAKQAQWESDRKERELTTVEQRLDTMLAELGFKYALQ